MFNRLSGALPRMLTLLGLVLAFVVLAGDGWAQYLVESLQNDADAYVFPFLSADFPQRSMLINAFHFQSTMFVALSGNGGNLSALNFLAITGALVGALLILFNSKNRQVLTLVAWTIVLVMLIFSPYGSKMLFHHVSGNDLNKLLTSESIEGTSCLDTPEKCGFTPQLAAIHVASVVQVLFSDVFRSLGWRGLIEEARATIELGESSFLTLDPTLKARIESFKEKCNTASLASLIENANPNNASRTSSNGQVANAEVGNQMNKPPVLLGDVWSEIATMYSERFDLHNAAPPPAIEFWSDEEFKAEQELNNWGADIKGAYEGGLTELIKNIPGNEGANKTVMIGGCAGGECDGTNIISVNDALNQLDAAGFFRAYDERVSNDDLMTGFFFYWKNTTVGSKDPDDGGQSTYYNPSAGDLRKCYKLNDRTAASSSYDDPFATVCNNGQGLIIVMPSSQQQSFKRIAAGELSFNQSPWLYVNSLFNGNRNSVLNKMPVKQRVYAPAPRITGKDVVPKAQTKAASSCQDDGVTLVQDVVKFTVGEGGSASNFTKIHDLLLGNTPIPAIFDTSHICTIHNGYSCKDYQVDKIGNDFAAYFNKLDNYKKSEAFKGRTPDEPDLRRHLMKLYLEIVDAATVNSDKKQTDAMAKANKDASKPDVVGSSALTWIGGGLASFLGGFLVQIGSFFVGPLAAAIIFFLSILVDLALMALIVLTPFLFLAGLFIPSNALGVLIVSILGVFVLKFVPVTLIILNNLGALIYTFVGIGAEGENEKIIQSMIIIAMGGLYASLVGMTFFLLFKMGDAAAIMSRFTALDSSAKDIAQRGMAATITAATAAGVLAAGGVGAAIGRGTLGMAAKKAAATVGIPPSWIEAAQKGIADDTKKPGVTPPTTPTPPVTGDEDEANKPPSLDGMTSKDQPIVSDDQEMKNMRAQVATDIADHNDVLGTTDKELDQLVNDGSFVREEADGNFYEYGLKSTDVDGNTVYGLERRLVTGKNGIRTAVPGDALPDMKVMGEKVAEISGPTDAGPPVPGSTVPGTGGAPGSAPAVTGEGQPGVGTAAAGAVAGIAATVKIDGGNLDSINEVKSLGEQAAGEQQSSEQQMLQKVQEKEEEVRAAEINDENNSMSSLAKRKGDAELVGYAEEMRETTNADEREAVKKKFDERLDKLGTSRQGEARKELYIRNMNDQIAQKIGEFDASDNGKRMVALEKKQKDGATLNPDEEKDLKDLKAIRGGLENFDTAAATQGELMSRLGTFEKLNASLAARGAADNLPGYWQSMKSGLYGAVAGTGSGLAKIPVIGPAIGEALNEYQQAPERARVWNSVGGFWKWRGEQDKAQRMGFFQKEMAPLGAAQQYNSMLAVGGFQAQADIARQAASEAVARSRSQWEAMISSKKMQFEAEIKSNQPNISADRLEAELKTKLDSAMQPGSRIYMTAGELTGLGRMAAADNVASVRQEAYLMQGKSLLVNRVKGGLDGKMQLTAGADGKLNMEMEEVGVILTPDALARVRGDLTTKANVNKFDEMMISHYGLTEKQYLRGDAEWNYTRNMNTSASAAAAFSRKDVSTDYLVGGHLKMVQGKEKFLEGKGQYETLLKFRNESNQKIANFVQKHLNAAGNDLTKALENTDIKTSKFDGLKGVDLAVNQRQELEKWAGKLMIKDKEYLPLNLLFESASINGTSKYELKAKKARSEMDSEIADNWMAVDKSRRAAISASMSRLNKSATKAARIDNRGIITEVAAPMEVFSEMIDTAFGDSAEMIFKTLADTVGKSAEKQARLFRSDKRDILGSNGKIIGRKIESYMDEDIYNEFYEKLDKSQQAKLDELQERYYRREGDKKVTFGYAEFDKDGRQTKKYNAV